MSMLPINEVIEKALSTVVGGFNDSITRKLLTDTIDGIVCDDIMNTPSIVSERALVFEYDNSRYIIRYDSSVQEAVCQNQKIT